MVAPARFPNGLEIRAAVEFRAVGRRLEGIAAPFDTSAQIGRFTETIRNGAFAKSIRSGADVLALVDHDPTRLLARTASGTLRLSEEARGLVFSIDMPDTSLGRDLLVLAERNDLGGVSIGFRSIDEVWPASDRRELRSVELLEISVIHAIPAYSNTSISARARGWMPAPDAAARRLILGRL